MELDLRDRYGNITNLRQERSKMDRICNIFFCLFTAGMIGLGAPASGATVDQEFVSTDDPLLGTAFGVGATSVAQTFSVGLSGTLKTIEFNILKAGSTAASFTIDIRPLAGDAPDPDSASALALSFGHSSGLGTHPSTSWTTLVFDVSFPDKIAVSPGDRFALVLSTSSGQEFFVQTDSTDAYAGGAAWSQSGDGTPFVALPAADLAFRTTVDVSTVPVPAAGLMFGSGLLGLFGFSGRRRVKGSR